MGANPQITRFVGTKVGQIFSYPLFSEHGNRRKCFFTVKVGDSVIGYEGGKAGIVAILKVKQEQNGKEVLFEKIESLASPISYTTMKKFPELERVVKVVRGKSLSELRKEEYEFIMGLIRENLEEADDKSFQRDVQDEDVRKEKDIPDSSKDKPALTTHNGTPIVKRDPRLAHEVIRKANYLCVYDNAHLTFKNKYGHWYMEAHHLIPCIPENADRFWKSDKRNIDSASNIVSLCPTCHRKIHYGSVAEKRDMIEHLYNRQKDKLHTAGFRITKEELMELYKV